MLHVSTQLDQEFASVEGDSQAMEHIVLVNSDLSDKPSKNILSRVSLLNTQILSQIIVQQI